VYLTLSQDRELIRRWALSGLLVISNGNYCLRRAQVERFADLLAIDEQEARQFGLRVRGL
jgi:hypothetical protein